MNQARILVLFLAVLLCPFWGARAEGSLPAGLQETQAEETARRAQELLDLSKLQNSENHALALETARQSLALWQTTDDRAGLARAYAQVAKCLLAQSDVAEAVENFQQALALWRQLDERREQAGALGMLGLAQTRGGEWAGALTAFTEAQSLFVEEDEPVFMGLIASGLAHVFNETGLPERGLEQYQRALEFYGRGGTPRDVALTEVGIGSTLHLLNRYDEAKSHLRQALESFAPGTLEAALCQHYLGKTFAATHEHAEAIRNLEAALAVYQRAGNPKEEAQVLALLGQVRQQQGRLGGARRFYARSLRRFERLSDRINQSAVLYALGRLEMRAGNLDAAEDFLKRSLDVTEGIRRAPASSDLTAAFSASVYERYETYVECLMRRHEARPDQALAARAFETSELARARSLTEWVRERQGSLLQGLDPKLAERERSLRLSLRVREDTRLALLNRRHRPDELAELEAELARLETEYVRVEEEIRARHPSFGRLITRAPAWDLRRIQERVVADDDTVLLEFGLGEEKGYVWAVTRDRIRSYELPPRELINEAARKVYALLSAPPRFGGEDELAAATRELSRLVLSPVASELNKRRLVVVADGALNYIPFQVLPSPAGGDEPLVASFQVVNAPSATTLGELRQEAEGRRPAAKVLAAFGDPVFASNYAQHLGSQGSGAALAAVQPSRGDGARSAVRDIELDGDTFDPASIQPLFYARRELTHLLAAAGTGSFVASDFAATREQLLGADLTQFAILHFATHGLLDPRRPEHSGLVFSTVGRDGRPLEGFVALQNIYGLRAPVSLVVLSACRTALGKDVRGEGLLGLTRAFMHAGASGVVASLWKVDDEATAELMKQFYTGMLREGQTPAEALRAAQNAVRQRPEWRSPYYWAAFTLQGESRPVAVTSVPAAGAMNLYLSASAGAALLMLSAGAGLWYLRRGRRARRA